MTAALRFVIISVATDTRGRPAGGPRHRRGRGARRSLGEPISGASMNPARSFAPALIAAAWRDQWVYWLAPVIGACLGGILYQLLR